LSPFTRGPGKGESGASKQDNKYDKKKARPDQSKSLFHNLFVVDPDSLGYENMERCLILRHIKEDIMSFCDHDILFYLDQRIDNNPFNRFPPAVAFGHEHGNDAPFVGPESNLECLQYLYYIAISRIHNISRPFFGGAHPGRGKFRGDCL
jgi:hypothetical protein